MILKLIKSIENIDVDLLRKLSRWSNRKLDFIFQVITLTGTAFAWIVCSLMVLIMNYVGTPLPISFDFFKKVMLTGAVAWNIGFFLKHICKRKRPAQVLEGFYSKVNTSLNDSLPSNHTSVSMSFFTIFLLTGNPLTVLVGLWTILVAFSRYYLGAHFPSDIIIGGLIGIGAGWLGNVVF